MTTKTPIKIPFDYVNRYLMYYVDEYKNKLTWFDKKTNRFWHSLPTPPSRSSWWYKEICDLEKAELLYANKYNDYLIEKKYFEDGVKDGTMIEIPMVIWKDNFVFEDTLFIDSYTRGRSAADFILVSVTTGIKYSMFLRDSLDMLQHAKVSYGSVTGKWTFCKRGANFGIKYIEEDIQHNSDVLERLDDLISTLATKSDLEGVNKTIVYANQEITERLQKKWGR